MAGSGSLEDIDELVSPVIQYFDGLKVLLHGSIDSDEGQYLEAHKGSGKIIYGEYVGRHDHSRCRLLYETGVKQGEILVSLDTLERVAISFAASLGQLVEWMNINNVDVVYYYGKPYVIRFREDIFYRGSPHESLQADYPLNRVEFSSQFPEGPNAIRINMRPVKRTLKHHFVAHYLRYYLLCASNQCLLGLENRGNPAELFPKRDAIRLAFRDYLRRHNVEPTVEAVVEMMKKPLDEEFKYFLSNEKIIQDAYRFFIENDITINDNHHWKDMKIYE